ncbi:MAG: DUF742 domain-containing protein [Carbonactinosporaceae bacterium]
MTGNEGRSARVRPYAITRGRTRSRLPLLLETLVSVPGHDPNYKVDLTPECQEIYILCRQVRSIIEISAQLRMPLGVVRVLVSDLADQGKVRVHATAQDSDWLGKELLERVLRGLQTLPG